MFAKTPAYKMDTSIYNNIGTNSKKAITDNITLSIPDVLLRAKVIKNEAPTIKPMAMNDAHILSIELISSTPNLS
jgi:hypothetical protein